MSAPKIEDYKPNYKQFNLSLTLIILLGIVYLSVFSYAIYAIVINWDALFIAFDSIYDQVDGFGSGLYAFLMALIAPFKAFIDSFCFSWEKPLFMDNALTIDLMISNIIQVVTIVVTLLLSGFFGKTFDAMYSEEGLYDYVTVTTITDYDLGTTREYSTYTSAASQASTKAMIWTAIIFILLIFLAPISTAAIMGYILCDKIAKCYWVYDKLRNDKKIYNGLKDGSLRIMSDKERKFRQEDLQEKLKPNKRNKLYKEFDEITPKAKQYIKWHNIFFVSLIVVGVITIMAYTMGLLYKVIDAHYFYDVILDGDDYNYNLIKHVLAKFNKYSSGTIYTFSLISAIVCLICGIVGVYKLDNVTELGNIHACVMCPIIFISLSLFIEIVNPGTYFAAKDTLQYQHFTSGIAGLIFAIVILVALFDLIDPTGRGEKLFADVTFTSFIIAIIFLLAYFDFVLINNDTLLEVHPDLLYMNMYLITLLILGVFGLITSLGSDIDYMKYYIGHGQYSFKRDDYLKIIFENKQYLDSLK